MAGNIRLVRDKVGIARLIFSRPEKKNALTGEMIRAIILHFETLQWEPASKLRFLVLEGEGEFFCSGADLSAMENAGRLSVEENIQEAFILARLFRELASLPFPTMARVRGGALAGAMGILAATDLVISEETAIFGTPEVRVGLLPAVISLYLGRKVGLSRLSFMSLLGRNFPADEALRMGLVHYLAPRSELDARAASIEDELLGCGPDALRRMKLLLLKASPLPDNDLEELAALQISEARASDEGKEGLAARKEKRSPAWAAKMNENDKD